MPDCPCSPPSTIDHYSPLSASNTLIKTTSCQSMQLPKVYGCSARTMSRSTSRADSHVSSSTSTHDSTTTSDISPIPQIDGLNDPRHKTNPAVSNIIAGTQSSATPVPPKAQAPPKPSSTNAVEALLPYCTVHTRLTNEQVIAVSDVAGSLKELVMLALGATVDEGQKETLEKAVGVEAADGIMEFFKDEWVADM
ncbi:hypothetical protein BDV96DRAFT_381400 [Lophiotrema nucula]|uniref:Uncharacterized protein n=1 Tax=Lophiotrema nucula TaxID=690887 RepID=A0A6A5ZGB7_9PLEO|nr:hypothetical protein BDV96DRAFT_381400 [Lophiotrema nucula]